MSEGKKVLVVDDDADCLEFAKVALERAGFEVTTATNGQEVTAVAGAVHPDAIILDVMMPEQDGWDTCDKLRSIRATCKVPIVFLTCVESPKTLYAAHGAFETDWDEYLTKPVTGKELVATVKRLLKRSERKVPNPG